MKSIPLKTVGLCLVAMFAVSLVTATTASAVPAWKQCRESAGTGTKWEESKCSKASSSGKWEWSELTTTESIRAEGTLRIKDGNIDDHNLVIQCSITEEGTIGPKQFDRITTITLASCTNVENCGGTIKGEYVNLPWQTALKEETKGEIRDEIISEVSGKEPGLKTTCTGVSDLCEGNTTAKEENLQTEGVVNSIFDSKSAKLRCSGGTESGEVTGTVKYRSVEGWAIRVS